MITLQTTEFLITSEVRYRKSWHKEIRATDNLKFKKPTA